MPSQIRRSKPDREISGYRDKAAKKKGRKSGKNKAPEKPESKAVDVAKPKVKRPPEWQAAREAGAERQADALVGLDAARAAAALRHVEISVSMFSASRRSKPTIAHVQFVKGGRVFAHYYPAVGRVFFGRKAKIADEGRYGTVEEAAARVVAYDDEHRTDDSRGHDGFLPRGGE